MEGTNKDKSENDDNPSDLKVADESKKLVSESETKLTSEIELVRFNSVENIASKSTSSDITCNEPHLEKSVEMNVSSEVCKKSLGVSEETSSPKLVEVSQKPKTTDEISDSLIEVDEKIATDSANLTIEETTSSKLVEASQETNSKDEISESLMEVGEKPESVSSNLSNQKITSLKSVEVSLEPNITDEISKSMMEVGEKPATDISNLSNQKITSLKSVEVSLEPNIRDEISEGMMEVGEQPATDSYNLTNEKITSPKLVEISLEPNTKDEISKSMMEVGEKPTTDVSNLTTQKTTSLKSVEVSLEPNMRDEISQGLMEVGHKPERVSSNLSNQKMTSLKSVEVSLEPNITHEISEGLAEVGAKPATDSYNKSNEKITSPKLVEISLEPNTKDEIFESIMEVGEKPASDSSNLTSEKITSPKLVEVSLETNTTDEISESLMEIGEKLTTGSPNLAKKKIVSPKLVEVALEPNTLDEISESLMEVDEISKIPVEPMETIENTEFEEQIENQHEEQIENEEEMDKFEKQNIDSNIPTDDTAKVEKFSSLAARFPEVADTDDLNDSDDGSQKIKLIFDEPDNDEARSFKENVMVQISGDIISGGKLGDPELLGDLGSPGMEDDLDLDAEMSESEILDNIEDLIQRSNTIKDPKVVKESISMESEKIQTDLEPEPSLSDDDTSKIEKKNDDHIMHTKSDDTKDEKSNKKDESNITVSGEASYKSITEDSRLASEGEKPILAPDEQKVDSELEKSKSREEHDLVEVEDALGLLAEAKPREEEDDENVGDDEEDDDDLEDDEVSGLEDSHHGRADSSEVESSTHQTEEDADALQYECGDSQYFTETEQSMDQVGGLDQDGENLDFEGSSGMGFIQSVSTVSVPFEEFTATKDESEAVTKIKKEKMVENMSKKDKSAESTPIHKETFLQTEETGRLYGREREKMVKGRGRSEEIACEMDSEIDIGEEMLILEGKVISSEEFFGSLKLEIEDIVMEKEQAEMEEKEVKEVDDDKVKKEMDVDIASEQTDYMKEDKYVETTLLDSSGNEDTEMVSLEEDLEKIPEPKDESLEKIPEKEAQLEKETSASQTLNIDDKSEDLTYVERKETPDIVAGRQEGSAASDDTEKDIITDKPADLPEKANDEVVIKLETKEKDDIIEATITDQVKYAETPDAKIVSDELDKNFIIPVDTEDKLQKSESDTILIESKESGGDSKTAAIVDKSTEVTANEAVVPSDQVPLVASTPEKRKTKVLALSNQDNVTVVDIVDLEESSSDSDDILVVPTSVEGERQREKSTSTVATTVESKEQSQSKTHEQTDVTDADKVVKKTEGEKKIDKKVKKKKKFEEASKKSLNAISKEAIPMPAPPVASITTEDKSKDNVMKKSDQTSAKSALHLSEGEEVFSLDSDNDFPDFDDGIMDPISKFKDSARKITATDLQKVKGASKCVNYACTSSPATATYHLAPMFVLSHYRESRTKRYKQYVCEKCLDEVAKRMELLVEDVRQKNPLKLRDDIPDVVLISDSDDDEDLEDALESTGMKLSVANVKFLEEKLAEMIHGTWKKYGLDKQVEQCKDEINMQLTKLDTEFLEVDELFNDLQRTTDMIRNDLYDSFAGDRHELPELEIMDTDTNKPEQQSETAKAASVGRKPSQDDDEWTPNKEPGAERRLSDVSTDTETRRSTRKRKSIPNYSLMEEDGLSAVNKAPVSASGPAPDGKRVLRKSIEGIVGASSDPAVKKLDVKQTSTTDDNEDITVVESARETAPAGLPPPGELKRTELSVGDLVYAVRQSTFGAWLQARVLEVWPKGTELSSGNPCLFTICKVRFEHKLKGTAVKQLTGRQLAYPEPANVRLPIGTRVIAIFKDPGNNYKKESYYSGVVAEMPNPVNSYRYLVFFDDGYAQYVTHAHTLAVCECSARVWEDVHPDSRDFVRKYLAAYPERPMVRLQPGQALKTEWSGKWWVSHVLAVDASLVQVRFDVDGRAEWIYRGSTRLAPLFLELQAAERHRPRGLTRTTKSNMPYVEYTRLDHKDMEVIDMTGGDNDKAVVDTKELQLEVTQKLSTAAQRAVAKKSVSVTPPPPVPAAPPYPIPDNVLSRVVYYTPKAAVKPHKMIAHTCSSACRRKDVLPLRELRTYNPLVRPLLVGWERMIHRFKGKKVVLYRAPCGRRLRDLPELHRYLRAVQSDMPVDLFDFHPEVHCLAEFVLGKCNVSKKDLSHGMESIPVPCVNYYDASLPEFCTYSTVRTPTDGVPLNLDSDFLCGCDCTDDCQDKTKCQCWKLTLAGAKTIGLEGDQLGYHYKRLPEPLPSGIYECNSRCKCAMTCLNRVVQFPLQLKLQVFKTSNRGWGIRTLNDVPRGAFLCVYAGNLLTDATANRDGVTEGDEYLAELDYIEVVERMKEGYESDVPDDDKTVDKKPILRMPPSLEEDEESEEEVEKKRRKGVEEDVDFRPEFFTVSNRTSETGMRLRKRNQKEKSDQDSDSAAETATAEKDKDKTRNIDPDDHFITISDDEEVREPSSFAAQAGLEDDEYVPKYRSVRSFFGKDEACYIMDAKVQGNLGRYLNHSCCPNVFVQNVFVDTHDPRFPWVAFFALTHVPAGTELTWNYNYDVGSVPNKVLYCACGAPNCRGRLL